MVLNDVTQLRGPNYVATRADLTAWENGRLLGDLFPEKRVYPVAQMPTTEAGIGDAQTGGGWAIRVYIKPFANWIWGGAIIMALGGLLSLTDRRYRVAAGARKAPATGGVPAE